MRYMVVQSKNTNGYYLMNKKHAPHQNDRIVFSGAYDECIKYLQDHTLYEIHIALDGAVDIPCLLAVSFQKNNIIFEGTKEECVKFYNVVKDTHLNIPFYVVKINGEYEIYHTSYDYLKKHNIEIILSAATCDECKKWIEENMKSYLDEENMKSYLDEENEIDAFNTFYEQVHGLTGERSYFEAGVNWMERHLLGKTPTNGDKYYYYDGEIIKCSKTGSYYVQSTNQKSLGSICECEVPKPRDMKNYYDKDPITCKNCGKYILIRRS